MGYATIPCGVVYEFTGISLTTNERMNGLSGGKVALVLAKILSAKPVSFHHRTGYRILDTAVIS